MSAWADLRAIRAMGQKPALPLHVTTDYRRCWDAHNQGALVIEHKPGERFEHGLLAGLDVVLHLDDCKQTYAVSRALQGLTSKPRSVLGWCKCEGELSTGCWPNCTIGDECREAWEALCRPKP